MARRRRLCRRVQSASGIPSTCIHCWKHQWKHHRERCLISMCDQLLAWQLNLSSSPSKHLANLVGHGGRVLSDCWTRYMCPQRWWNFVFIWLTFVGKYLLASYKLNFVLEIGNLSKTRTQNSIIWGTCKGSKFLYLVAPNVLLNWAGRCSTSHNARLPMHFMQKTYFGPPSLQAWDERELLQQWSVVPLVHPTSKPWNL